MVVVVGIVACVGLAALLLWGIRLEPNDDSHTGAFNAITGTGGGGGDFVDPQRGIIGPDEADIERFGDSGQD